MIKNQTIYHEFHLQPSRIKWIIHGATWLILQSIFFNLLKLEWWIIILILSSICSVYFIIKQQNWIYLGYLDDKAWTIVEQCKNKKKNHNLLVINMIDHQVYINIDAELEGQPISIIIWQDQVDRLSWKALKTRTKYKQFD